MSPGARAARPVTFGLGLALALGMIAAVRATRPAAEEPGALIVQPGGLPAAGVTLWCGLIDAPPATPTRRSPPTVWVRGVTDAQGRLSFEADPGECILRGDGVDVLGPAEQGSSGRKSVVVVPSFRCESALIAVEGGADWLSSWYRPGKGFSPVRRTTAANLASSVRDLWLEHGERRDLRDRQRDCAIVVSDSRPGDALSALAAVTRPILAGHPEPNGGFVSRETALPALDIRVWSPEALCAWVAAPLPAEMAQANPHGFNCSPRPAR